MSNAKIIWSVDFNDFPVQGSSFDKLKFLLRYAILAPSGHNTQPWLFSINGESVEILANTQKRLFIMDPIGREFYLSLGACLANLSMAAEAFGIHTEVSYFPQGTSSDLVAKVTFSSLIGAKLKDSSVLTAIVNRRNNREKYLPTPITEQIKESWLSLVKDPTLRLDLVSDPVTKERIGEATAQGLRLAFSNRDFREELASWLRNNFVKCEDGIPINTTDMPVPSLIAATLVRLLDIGPIKARNDKKKLSQSPIVAVISSLEDNPTAWVKSGELFESIQVLAAKDGLASAVLVAAIEEGDLYKRVQEALGMTLRPQMIFRLGYPQKVSLHSPRIPVEKLLVERFIRN